MSETQNTWSEPKRERRTLDDGTVQITCAYRYCTGGRWFDVAATGRPARFCSTNCRVQNHRMEKRLIEENRLRVEHELRLAKRKAEHRDDWVTFLFENTPDNGRMTEAACVRLYEAMMEAEMIEGPFPQHPLF